ncbi:metastasis-suppressor KiSS-1 [Sebastes umbrosus]|uniref:metastasis-suppressor KiSS-1 n=1 Tax=Sebastes umbrosus TaxID=72105 RepID=UPI0018A04E61|nr:metastasis-suppressor KiSS-1 [Sebastes umbrosus]
MMPRLIVALMMAALSTEVYITSGLTSTYYSEDQEILKALRDLSHASLPPSVKSSGNLPADEVHSADGKFPRAGWWISKVVLPQTIKKRQDVSSYNLNSFGLRYGKRQET